MDDDRPKTIRLIHPEHGLVLCTAGDEAPWLDIGYQVEGAGQAAGAAAPVTNMVKPKRLRVRKTGSDDGAANEVALT